MSDQTVSLGEQPPKAEGEALRAGFLWLAAAAVGLLALFWPGLTWLLGVWERPEYSHAYLIPLIAAFLFVRQVDRDDGPRSVARGGRRLGLTMLLLGVAVGLAGNVLNYPGINIYGILFAVAGLVLIAMGDRRGLRYWPPVVYLVFMLPLPSFLYYQLSIQLQLLSSKLGVALIGFLGVPVYLSGNIIDLGVYQLHVAEACSGLRYLFPLMSFGFLFAVLYTGPAWHRVLLFLSSLPITVAMNSFRIGVIGFLVNSYGIEQAEGFLHFFEGWVIFIACIGILFLEASLLRLFTRDRRPLLDMVAIDFGSLADGARRIASIGVSRALVVASIASLLVGVGWQLSPERVSAAPQRAPLVLFPLQLGDWTGTRSIIDPATQTTLGADDYLLADYAAAGEQVNFFVAYYQAQSQGVGYHSPEVCIPAGGWDVSAWNAHDTGISLANGETLRVNRTLIQKGLSRQLVYYWFQERGRSLISEHTSKLHTIADSLVRNRTDGAMVRVTTPIAQAGSIADADARLTQFLTVAFAELSEFVPP